MSTSQADESNESQLNSSDVKDVDKGDTTNDLFKKMAVNDAKQNKRLSDKLNSTYRGSGVGNKFIMTGKKAAANDNNSKDVSSDKATKMRFVVCTLGLVSIAMSQMSRMVLNQSITQMVDPSMLATSDANDKTINLADGSCPWPEEELNSLMGTTITSAPPMDTSVYSDDSWTPETTTATTTTGAARSSPSTDPSTESSSKTTLYSDAWTTTTTVATAATTTIPTTTTLTSETSTSDSNMNELPDLEWILDKEDTSTLASSTAVETSQTMANVTELVSEVERQAMTSTTYPYARYKWTVKQQSVLLGGFHYSYFAFMVLGGRMAEVYGAKYVLLLSVAGSAVINIMTPWLAQNSFVALVMSRVLMGAMQAGVFPGMYALIARWLTMTEASIYAPLIKMSLGMVLGSLVPGLVEGWPNVFYLTAALNITWCIVWLFVATSDPADNKWVSSEELAQINRKKRKPVGGQRLEIELEDKSTSDGGEKGGEIKQTSVSGKPKRSLKTPWAQILTAPPVIALIIVKLTLNSALDFLVIELPSYLKYVHHASRQKISAITTPMFGTQVCLIAFVGWLAKVTIQKRPFGMSKTNIRKMFQGVANLGISTMLFLITFNDCNLIYVAVLLELTAIMSMFTVGGDTMLPYDLSDQYPATIVSIANSVANISGATTTALTGFVLGDQMGNYNRWNKILYTVSGFNLFGYVVFLLLVEAKPIDFDQRRADDKAKKKKTAQQRDLDIECASTTQVRKEVPRRQSAADIAAVKEEAKERAAIADAASKTTNAN